LTSLHRRSSLVRLPSVFAFDVRSFLPGRLADPFRIRFSGMAATAARTILESLDRLPNVDGRTKVGIIAVDVAVHFFSLPVSPAPSLSLPPPSY
jgi:hypothetical protein